ncbi:phosphotransferase [Streptomyces sp. NPDC007988]|uniref:phosphotransferase n=1 Tax=Streptomyces sp. NPDC007988 TaxID=3364802 RepID=UPI0036ED2D8B
MRRLLRGQLPRWADLPVTEVASAGTAHAVFRLGRELVVRLPRTRGSADDVDREHRWLTRIAPSLPAAVPAPLGRGVPAGGFPWPWSVYGRLSGDNPVSGRLAGPTAFAGDLADFVAALHRSPPRVRCGCRRRSVGEPGFSSRSPPSGPVSYRAEPLSARDAGARAAIGALDGPDGTVDAGAAVAAWEASLRVPGWNGPRVWAHADLQPGESAAPRGTARRRHRLRPSGPG